MIDSNSTRLASSFTQIPSSERNIPAREELDSGDAPGRLVNLRLVLVRHGEANLDLPLHPLSGLGREQATCLAERFAEETFDYIYSSDLSRALETAEIICAHHRKVTFTVDPDLREIGCCTPVWNQGNGNTKLVDVNQEERDRVDRFCRQLPRRHGAGEQVLIVAHGNLIRLAISLLSNSNLNEYLYMETYNTSVTKLLLQYGSLPPGSSHVNIELANCVNHLRPVQVT